MEEVFLKQQHNSEKKLALMVLIAARDKESNRTIVSALREKGVDVLPVTNASELLQWIRREKPDLIILDRLMPPGGGIDLCKKIRNDPDTAQIPIVMISEDGDVEDRIEAMDAGADDYMAWPFNLDEMVARLKVLQHKHYHAKPTRIITVGIIEMNLDTWTVTVSGKPVKLTIKEFRLLQELLEAKGRVLSREVLLERVWGSEKWLNLQTRTVDIHMSRLRNKLGEARNYIITVRNIGYRIDIVPEWIIR